MAAKANEARHFSRWPMNYGVNNESLDPGQVFTLAGMPNDEKLVRLGYCAPLEKGAQTFECAECGSEFVDVSDRDRHGRKRHRERGVNPDQEDRESEREEQRLMASAPLYLDQSIAARA